MMLKALFVAAVALQCVNAYPYAFPLAGDAIYASPFYPQLPAAYAGFGAVAPDYAYPFNFAPHGAPLLVDPSPVIVDPSPVVVDPSPVLVDPSPKLIFEKPVLCEEVPETTFLEEKSNHSPNAVASAQNYVNVVPSSPCVRTPFCQENVAVVEPCAERPVFPAYYPYYPPPRYY